MVRLGASLIVGTIGLWVGCGGGGRADPGVPEGASSPAAAVEAFLSAAKEAHEARGRGELGQADRSYNRMAAVFGTEAGTIRRSRSSEEVRSRMIVLSACLRPVSFRVVSGGDIDSRMEGRVVVTAELQRADQVHTLPFRVVRGSVDRWFIEQIELGSFAC